jgi:hypothetical protein
MMNVIIVDAGLGGLRLGPGAEAAGIGVTVLEADRAPEARKQGYRLNINASGASALAACLSGPLLRLYQATSHHQLEPTVTMYTPDLQPVFQRLAATGTGPFPPSAMDWATLRRIQLSGSLSPPPTRTPCTAEPAC